MNAFVVELANQPGELARITEAIATKGINVIDGAGVGWGTSGAFAFWTNDEAGTRSVLRDLMCKFQQTDVVMTGVADEPGTLARVAHKLSNAGVNIEFIVPAGMSDGKVSIAIGVTDAAAARAALGETAAAAV